MTARLVRLLRRSTIRSSCSHRTGVDYYQSVKLLFFFLTKSTSVWIWSSYAYVTYWSNKPHSIYYLYNLILHDEKIGRLYEIDSKVPITQAFVWKRTRREKNQPLANRVNVLRSSPPPFKQDIWHNEKRR